ncbi:LOW QUALITY PROTEIN: retinoblastoma family protein [Drosophila gunungcola]|uniref:LOW QUALITY PROTEIN: retinoblastoma family protein n=1 Tax=Drosophila gunungcola TaxID=103775 RepID=UPI0022E5A172|nr:LOW QUALITY PROTEIN: retinoblastoma family protein [Drosophila gunungcola]
MNICEAEGEGEALVRRFSASCEQLELDPRIQQSALATYRRVDAAGGLSTSEGEVQEWLCCAVYSELQRVKIRDIRRESQNATNEENEPLAKNNCWNLSLTRLLRVFKVNVSHFLRRMEHWNWLAQNENTFQLEVEDLRRRLGITLTLLRHYKNIFKCLFVRPAEDADPDSLALYHSLYEFGWLLFLVIRNELPGFATTNLINGCQVLVCSMDLLFVNALEMPLSEVISRDFAGVPKKWVNKDFNASVLNKYSALKALGALIPELPLKGVQQIRNAFFHKALMLLFMEQSLVGDDTHMREIIKEGMLDINLGTLNRKYSGHIADISEMDERVLLCFNETKELKKVSHNNSLPASQSSFSSPLYKKLLAQDLPQCLSTVIRKALRKGENGENVVQYVEQTVKKMDQTFAAAAKDYLNAEAAGARFRLARGLYSKFLLKIVAPELALKPQLKISQLLRQRTLTTTLLACCLELALHVHDEHVDGLRFPFVLDCYSLDAYDFQKILELVVRHDQGFLGRELVKHLHVVEDKCLESLILRKSSQLWWNLGEKLPSYQEVQSEADGKENTSPGAGICLRKFYGLANRRLLLFCQSLCLVDSFPRIWHLVEHSFTMDGGRLLRNRHMDQLLLCAIHLHVRLESLGLSFSMIIQHYRRQPNAQRSVYREVDLGNGQTADVIRFYNSVYVRSMGHYGRHLDCEQSRKSPQQPKTKLGILQETSANERHMLANISISSPPPPKICQSGSCSSLPPQSPAASPLPTSNKPGLKRACSSGDLSDVKRPNILRRRTCIE